MQIGDRIKKIREQLNMSQDELAKKVGYKSRSSINKIEVDGRGLPLDKIEMIAKALNTTPAYLMGWEEKIDRIISSKITREQMAFALEYYANKNSATLDNETIAEIKRKHGTDDDIQVINIALHNIDFLVKDGHEKGIKKFNDVLQYDEPSDLHPDILPLKGRTKKIPLLGEIACGEPIFANREYELYEEVAESLNADFCLKAKGDSMVGARIEDGDIVFIKECPEVYNGEIAAVIIDDSVTLKRVYYNKEQQEVVLSAENNAYPPQVYRNEELTQIRILGKAIGFQSVIK